MKSTFEKMGGTYTLGADGIYYPNLVSTDEEPHYGKYGMMRKTYLKEHRPAMYSLYMLEDRLTEHLNAVDDEAQERMDILMRQMIEQQGITEELKARDVDNADLGVALKAANEEVQNVIFKNLSKRLAAMIKEDMEFMGPVRMKDVEEAQQKVVSVIRKLEDSGEIVISRGGGDEIVV